MTQQQPEYFDMFADGMLFELHPMSSSLVFQTTVTEGETRRVTHTGRVRLTLEHAQIACILLWKHLMAMKNAGRVGSMPLTLIKEHGIPVATWNELFSDDVVDTEVAVANQVPGAVPQDTPTQVTPT